MNLDAFSVLVLSLVPLPALAQDGAGESGKDSFDVFTQEELEAKTEEIRLELEELRGQDFLRPVAVQVTNKAGLQEYMKARMERTTTEQEIRDQELLYKLLGLMPLDMDFLGTLTGMLEDQVGGFYDPEDDTFYLMDTYTGDLARVILAHELTHALDDQLYDIDGTADRFEEDDDASWAFHAVVEGSATALMTRWMLKHMGDIDMEEAAKGSGPDASSLADVPAILWKPLLGSYLVGANFLARTDNMMAAQMKQVGGLPTADVAQAFEEPPRSSEQVLHPDKYWEEPEEPVPVTIDTSALPEGWEVPVEMTFGELGLALLAGSDEDRGGLVMPEDPMGAAMKMMALGFTNPAAEGWGGDRAVLLRKGTALVLLVETVWDTEADARQFAAALEGRTEALHGCARGLSPESGSGAGQADVRLEDSEGLRVRLSCWSGLAPEEAGAVIESLLVQVGD